MRVQWLIFVKLCMWVVGAQVLPIWSVITECKMRIFNTSFPYICSDLLITKKIKYPEFYMGYIDETWYVGSDGHKYYPCGLSSPNAHIPHLHICSDWLITQKSSIQSSIWATLMTLGMWVVMGTSTTHVVCHHPLRIFNTSFPYICSDWLITKKNQISRVLYGLHWWNLVCGWWWAQVLPTWSVVTKCAYLIPH